MESEPSSTTIESAMRRGFLRTRKAPAERPDHCLNCGAAVGGRYCENCGQETTAHILSVRELARDILAEYLSADSKLWRSLRLLLLKPGALTNEYLAGRRQRYLSPGRVFLLCGVPFFFLILLQDPVTMEHLYSFFGADDVKLTLSMTGMSESALLERVNRGFGNALPIVLLFVVPLLAAIMKILYVRHHVPLAKHLVFSFHYIAFVLGSFVALVLIAVVPLMFVPALTLLVYPIYGLAVAGYLPIALRKVYGQSWPMTLLKGGALLTWFLLIMLFYLAVSVGVSYGIVAGSAA